jgi:hypothetical protein
MFSSLAKIFGFVSQEHSSSFLAGYGFKLIWVTLVSWFGKLMNFLANLFWTVMRFVLGIMEAFEFIINNFLGIDTSVEDYYTFAKDQEFLSVLVDTFKAILAVAIVLLLIFSIYAIIKQEFQYAVGGFGADGKVKNNEKWKIIKNILIKIMSMLLLPITMVFLIAGVNSILTAFNRAMKGDVESSTVASSLLASSMYSGNRYRTYADNNKRYPIVIEAYDTSDYKADESVLLANKIKTYEVQNKLENAVSALTSGGGISFASSLKYQNNKLTNSTSYADYYESFVCTREQYYVMADFIDYCEKTGKTYYIKSVDDVDIDWKYVDSAVFDQTNYSLTINYTDADDIDGDGSTSDSYTITYSTSYDVTSPISDALDSIMAMLGIGDYETEYNEMEREDGSTNIVQWANEKVLIQFSDDFDINNTTTWTSTDQIIMYEYYHYSSNNTLSDYALSDLYSSGTGAEIDAKQITYRDKLAGGAYSDEKTIYCVLINGTYYLTEKSNIKTDSDGNYYYVLKNVDGTNFLSDTVVKVFQNETDTALIQLSSGFNINDYNSWTYSDQIIVYEYYKDLSYSNNLSSYSFSDFATGIRLPIYEIQVGTSSDKYVILNGTYYKLNGSKLLSPSDVKFLEKAGSSSDVYYEFQVSIGEDNSTTGIGGTKSVSSFIISSTSVTNFSSLEITDDMSEALKKEYDKYSSFEYKTSSNFNFKDVDTWTYRDYFLFCLYIKYPTMFDSVDSLKYSGLSGNIGKGTIGGTSYYLIQMRFTNNDGDTEYVYFNIDSLNSISQLNIQSKLNVDETLQSVSIDTNSENLFIQNDDNNTLVASQTEYVKLTFSDGFSEYNISTWTVQDMLLTVLSYGGYINGISSIENYGYSALVYNIADGSSSYSLYKFGKQYSQSDYTKTIYLNSKFVTGSLGYSSMDEFFRSEAINYVLKSSGLSVSDIIADDSSIIDTLFESYSDYVLGTSTLFERLINDRVANIYSNIVNYTYSNEFFAFENLSTWTNIDIAIYYITGSASGSYTSSVVLYNSQKYFILGDEALQITGTSNPFAATISENNTISSTDSASTATTYAALQAYYNSNLSSVVHSRSELGTLINLSNSKYSYYSNKTITSSSVSYSGNLTDFDIILANNGGLTTGNHEFNLYTDGTKNYILVNGKYVEVSDNQFDSISFNTTGTLTVSDTSKKFSTGSTYTSFDTNLDGTTYLDAVIYNLTKKTDSVDYTIYSASSIKYIVVGTKLVQYTSDYASSIDLSLLSSSNSVKAKDVYSTYLKSLYYTNRPESFSSEVITDVTYRVSSFKINDVTTWTSLKLILHENNIIADEVVASSPTTINGIIYTNVSGSNKYFSFNSTVNGTSVTNYIKINDIADISSSGDETTGLNYSIADKEGDNFLTTLKYLLSEVTTDGSGNVQSVKLSETLNTKYLNFKQKITSVLSLNSYIKTDFESDVDASSFNIEDASTWNGFDIAYYYYTNNIRSISKFAVYIDNSGYKYLKITSSDGGDYYVLYNTTLFSGFHKELKTIDVKNNEFEPISVVVRKLMNVTTTTNIYLYSLSGNEFYYIESISGTFYGIYKIPADTATGFTTTDTNTYTYATVEQNNFLNYSAFDFILAYTAESSDAESFSSKITKLNGDDYLSYNNNYINITKLKDKEIISINSSTHVVSASKTLKSAIGFTNDGSNSLLRVYKLTDSLPEVARPTSSTSAVGEDRTISLSSNFDASDFSTWGISDFIIYYLFSESLIRDSSNHVIVNFQDIVQNGGIDAKIYNLLISDEYGNATTKKVIKLNGYDDVYINYSVFTELYARQLYNYTVDTSKSTVTLSISETSNTAQNDTYFEYSNKIEVHSFDFVYNNYYFFKVQSGALQSLGITKDSTSESSGSTTDRYQTDSMTIGLTINLKLSDDFEINDLSTWTILDYIIIKEFSNENVQYNFFDGFSFNDLKKNNYYFLYKDNNNGSNIQVLEINGNQYNLGVCGDDGEYKYLTLVSGSSDIYTITKKINDSTTTLISSGSASSYTFRTLYETINFNSKNDVAQNDLSENIFNLQSDYTTLAYSTETGSTTYRWVDTRLSIAYQIDTSSYYDVAISNIVKKVNWPQKLMNDMQVIYPDLNWANLIATDGWLDTLGDFSSSSASGEYFGEGNSANITATGLVLSEFLLSVAEESEKGFADYEYQSIFGDDTIKSLMLSMLGEDEYESLKLQADIFLDMFNTSFAVVLEDIASETGINIVDGKVDNLTMSVYKAYLATVLLSSDLGEYLYRIATRVYAQYTIYEYLATASGDYAKYYNYINGFTDENGDTVDSFNYASFYELTKYENLTLGKKTPTFSFNIEKVYEHFKGQYAASLNVENFQDSESYFYDLLEKLDNYYQNIYTSGGRIDDTDDMYCFLLDVYWTMYSDFKSQGYSMKNFPSYLTIFHNYLLGNLSRWNVLSDVSADGGIKYLSKYSSYTSQLSILKVQMLAAGVKLFSPEADVKDLDEDYGGFFNSGYDVTITSAVNVVSKCFSSSAVYSDLCNKTLNYDLFKNAVITTNASENGDVSSWNTLLTLSSNLNDVIEKFSEVMNLSVGDKIDGCTKADYSDDTYNSVYKTLCNYQNYLDSYISVQKMIDKVQKTSITYTLSQFGQNYVSSGFNFTIENRNYTLTSAVSSLRLAEYVYGGNFLTQFGIEPTYTSSDFEGIIQESRAYDSTTGAVLYKIISWDKLRTFASRIADYTAKLYYMTNFMDLSDNVNDSILMTDTINVNINNNYEEVSLEYGILYYLLSSSDITISDDTFVRLMFGDTSTTLNNLNCSDEDINKLAASLEINGASLPSGFDKKATLIKYLKYVWSTSYNSYGYYNDGGNTPNERIHMMFVNVFTYLLVSEEDTTGNDNAINFDGWTMKEFRTTLIEFIVKYVQNPSETGAENAARYLAIYYLINSQYYYYYNSNLSGGLTKNDIGTTISSVYVKKEGSGVACEAYYYINGETDNSSAKRNIYADFSIDTESSNKVIELAGISNRPLEELVNLEYDHLYNKYGNYDEAKGDTFVVCFYDEVSGKYIPFMSTDTYSYSATDGAGNRTKFAQYMDAYGYRIYTTYVNTEAGNVDAYPIIAKGIIMADGMPTAIKIEDYQVKFYRTNITSTLSVDDDAVEFSKVTTEVNTIGFSSYSDSSTFTSGGANKNAMFIGSSDQTYFVNSGFTSFYIQYNISYTVPGSDDLGGINVLDSFDYFFTISMPVAMMLIFGIVMIMPILFNGTAAVMRRVLDLILLVLTGPLVISSSALDQDKDTKGFKKWKDDVARTLLGVFGYIIGFNVYYILIQTITGMTFVTDITMNKISSLGVSFISKNFVNSILKYIYIIVAGGMIKVSSNTIVSIMTAGKVTDAFNPSGKNVMGEVKAIGTDLKKIAEKADGILTGKALLEAKDAAIQSIPGMQIAKVGKEFVDRRIDKHKGKALEKALKGKVSPSVAKEALKKMQEAQRQQRELKRKSHEKSANKFMQSINEDAKDTFNTSKFLEKKKPKDKSDRQKTKEKFKQNKKVKKEKKKIEKKDKKDSKSNGKSTK